MTEDGSDLPARVGARLREARQLRRLSLRSLAKETSFSASFLSQVERGQVSPSLASLQKIAKELGLSLASLVADDELGSESVRVRRRGARALRSEWSLASVESLAHAPSELGFEPLAITLEPGGHTGSVGGSFGAGLAICLRGAVVMEAAGRRHELTAGDSATYGPNVEPTWSNPSDGVAEILVIAPVR